jgi:2-methylcitrate dehydratase PrpD
VLEFPYTDLAIVSSLIYTTFGFLAAKRVNISAGAAVGAILGLTDATIGWAISWSIGPGYVPEAAGRPLVIAAIILYVIAIAAGCAFVGAITAKIWARLATP